MSRNKRPSGKPVPGLRLLADIGGTNARFALARRGRDPYAFHVLRTRDYGGPAQAIAAYLRRKARSRLPETAVIAVAGPITGDVIHLTNFDASKFHGSPHTQAPDRPIEMHKIWTF